MSPRRPTWLALAAATAALAGGGGSSGSPSSEPTAAATAAATPVATLRGDLDYERSGGFAGYADSLVVTRDGKGRLRRRIAERPPFELAPAEITALAEAFERADFAALPADSASKRPSPDLLEYRIAYAGHTVRTDDATSTQRLDALIAMLDQVFEAHAG